MSSVRQFHKYLPETLKITKEEVRQCGIEHYTPFFLDESARVRYVPGLFIDPRMRYGVEHINKRSDPCLERDAFAGYTVGIPSAAPLLVVAERDISRKLQYGQPRCPENRMAYYRVLLYYFKLIGSQLVRLVQYSVCYADLSHVVQR